jgi:Ca2+-binding EF-hand superfamily protein
MAAFPGGNTPDRISPYRAATLAGLTVRGDAIGMTRSIACALAVAAVGWALAGPASAGPPPPKPPPTPQLFLSPSGEPFRLGPTDPDPLKAWFDQADTAHQGYLDRSEFRADAARYFKTLDENRDGVIDGFEVADYEHKIVPELTLIAEGRYSGQPGERETHSSEPQQRHRHGQPPQSAADSDAATPTPSHVKPPSRVIAQLIDEPEPVSGADLNMDSHITLAEWMRAADDRFDLLDSAHTGRLTLDALRTLMNASLRPPKR